MPKSKSIAVLLILWIITFVLVSAFIIPNTKPYQIALQKYENIATEKSDDYPTAHKPFKYGFALGYLLFSNPLFLLLIFGLQTLFTVFIFILFKKYQRQRSKKPLLPDPLESLKNIISNIFLFTFGIFLRRASDQLKVYFNLSVKSRIIALLAYALIFISIFTIFEIKSDNMFARLEIISYVHLTIALSLIALVFFVKSFRKNYQKRLFWISLSIAVLSWIASSYAGFQLAHYQLANPEQQITSFWDARAMLFALFVVLAFSFYFEVMKSVFAKQVSMEKEIDLAKRIQDKIVPAIDMDTPSCSVYGKINAASEVGGDYCDAVLLSKNRLVLAVGDVTGHNVAAGVLMSMLKSAFHTELRYLEDLGALHSSLNRTMFENTDKQTFISFLSVALDLSAQTVTLVNCGHPPLLYYCSKNHTISDHRSGDMALGLQASITYNQQTLVYESGDMFILISDGVIETLNSMGNEFGLQSIKKMVLQNASEPPQKIYNALIKATDTFRGKIEQRDDITILILKMA